MGDRQGDDDMAARQEDLKNKAQSCVPAHTPERRESNRKLVKEIFDRNDEAMRRLAES